MGEENRLRYVLEPYYAKRSGVSSAGSFTALKNKFQISFNNTRHYPTSEEAVAYLIMSLHGIENVQIFRERALWEKSEIDGGFVHIGLVRKERNLVEKQIENIREIGFFNLFRSHTSSLSLETMPKSYINQGKYYIEIEFNKCLIELDISRFSLEEQNEVFNQQLAPDICHLWEINFYEIFLLCRKLYEDFLSSLAENSRTMIYESGNRFFESYLKIRAKDKHEDFERWIDMEVKSASLEKRILPITQPRKIDEYLTCNLESASGCQNFFKEIPQEINGLNKLPKYSFSCINCFIMLRNEMWKALHNSRGVGLMIGEGRNTIENLEGMTNQNLRIAPYIRLVRNLDKPKELNFSLPPPDFFSNLSPINNNLDIAKWAFKHFAEIEYYRTILFAIYAMTIDIEGAAKHKHLSRINELWSKISDNIDKFILSYLRCWAGKKISKRKNRNDYYIIFTPEWLLGWFGYQYLKSDTFESYTNKKELFSPEEALIFNRHLSTLYLYILFWIRKYGNTKRHTFSDTKNGYESVLDATIYLICEYAYIDGGLTREASLYRTLRYMWSHQSILYTLGESYRDHLHHVIELCLMGLCFLNTKGPLKDQLPFCMPYLIRDRKKVIRNWIVAALFHDVGYGVEILKLPLNHLSFFEADLIVGFSSEMRNSFSELEKKYGSDSCKTLRANIPNIRIPDKNLDNFDHGIISALSIAALIDTKRKSWLEDMTPAIEAAALHNCRASRIDPNSMPLAFLLFLCDHLQEWDRPFIEGEAMRYSLLVNLTRPDWYMRHHGVSLIQVLECEGMRLSDDGRLEFFQLPLTFTLAFEQVGEEKYYPPLTWVGHGRDFQKVTGCQLPLKVKFRHPVSQDKNHRGSPLEMDLFQHFLRESGKSAPGTPYKKSGKREVGNSVLREWSAKAREGKSWFNCRHYEREDGVETEEMVFELNRVDNKKFIPALPPRLVKHFISWRNKYTRGLYEPAGLSSFNF